MTIDIQIHDEQAKKEQIGTALEYYNPDVALSIIHKRHGNRLDPLSAVIKMISKNGKYYDKSYAKPVIPVRRLKNILQYFIIIKIIVYIITNKLTHFFFHM